MARIGRVSVTRIFGAIVVLLAIGTVVGLALLWPDDVDSNIGESIVAESEGADVTRVEEFRCSGFQSQTCQKVSIELRSGPRSGESSSLSLQAGGLDPDVDVGDRVRVVENITPPGAEPIPGQEFSLSDFERGRPMLFLALMFAGLVILFGRLRGALSLVGLGLSLAVVLLFVAPAIQGGKSPLAVAVVGAMAVMLVTITLAHGLGPKSLAAILGTAASLVVTVALAVIFTDLTHLTGLSSEEATFLLANEGGLSLEGLLLAGMVIGALGVLDDVTISQASTVLALRGANPAQRFGELFGRALDVGRDHVSATVNTLVLAYVGAALPVLLIFTAAPLGFVEAVNLELIAKEVVATLVGSIGLITAVPITTALAAVLARHIPAEQLPAEDHTGHAH